MHTDENNGGQNGPASPIGSAGPAPSVDGRVLRAARLREERRAQVLATARRLFAERGYHATSIADIIEACGIARGTFYLYFPSKRLIFDELLDLFFATVQAAVRRVDVSPGAAPPLEQMEDNVRRLLDVLAAERETARILLRGTVGIDEEFDRKLGDFYGRVHQLIERGLRLGVELGLVRPLDPAVAAWCVLGSIKEAVDRVLLAGDPPSQAGVEALGRDLMAFNLHGLFR